MKSHVQVAVIGGGVVGCSVLYHLTKKGWKDVVLIERDELTSGSTWHAAGGMHTLNGDPFVAKLQAYTINLYRELEEISGQSCGIHMTGGVMLAGTKERMDFLKTAHAKGRYLGMDTQFITPEEAKTRLPILDPKHFVGGLWDDNEGHVDPNGVTQAYAKAARLGGAEVYLRNPVVELVQNPDATWQVITREGTITADVIVNAGGLWAREVGRMFGVELPVLAMEHQYLLTEEIPEVAAYDGEVAHAIDFEGEAYLRQEQKGILLGTYERAGVPWSEHDTPQGFSYALLQPDLDRIAPSLEVAFEHFPPLAQAGIRKVINGPFTFAPDGNPLVGPMPGIRNCYVACGVMAGFSQGGGVGLALSNWIVDGDPGLDVLAMDVARFGPFATPAYTKAKVMENYSRRFRITFPNEELAAARPLRTTTLYPRLKEQGAVFGAAFGLEHALWFAPPGTEATEDVTFRRSNAFGPVGEECRAVRTAVGLLEISSFSKYEVSGPGAEAWLSELLANRMPRTGRILLSPMLNEAGKIIGDFTVAKLAEDRFMLFGSGAAEMYHMRWFRAHLPDSGVALEDLCPGLTGLQLAGPKARDVLAKLTRLDLATAAMPFMSVREAIVGPAPAIVSRISFTGELGYEIWVTPDYLMALFDALMDVGAEHGLRLFGGRALNSLRLEKSFGGWLREYRPSYGPIEAGMDRFVDFRKNRFIGRQAALATKDAGPENRLITLVVDAGDADCIGDEPILHDGETVGWVTSGGYGHVTEKSIALGYVPAGLATGGNGAFEIELLGEMRPATRVSEPLHDPQGTRMRT